MDIRYSKSALRFLKKTDYRIIGAITIMSESDAEKVWKIIMQEFSEEVDPSEEELEIIKAYNSGDEEYQPYISHQDIKKELGIVKSGTGH